MCSPLTSFFSNHPFPIKIIFPLHITEKSQSMGITEREIISQENSQSTVFLSVQNNLSRTTSLHKGNRQSMGIYIGIITR